MTELTTSCRARLHYYALMVEKHDIPVVGDWTKPGSRTQRKGHIPVRIRRPQNQYTLEYWRSGIPNEKISTPNPYRSKPSASSATILVNSRHRGVRAAADNDDDSQIQYVARRVTLTA